MKTIVLALAVVTAAAGTAAPALAGPKQVTKTFTATAPAPDPTNAAPGSYSVCPQRVPSSYQAESFKVPAAGRLTVEVTGYQGDWDALLMDGEKGQLAYSGSGGVGGPEVIEVSFKKAQPVTMVACNFSGGPTAQVKYTFTYR